MTKLSVTEIEEIANGFEEAFDFDELKPKPQAKTKKSRKPAIKECDHWPDADITRTQVRQRIPELLQNISSDTLPDDRTAINLNKPDGTIAAIRLRCPPALLEPATQFSVATLVTRALLKEFCEGDEITEQSLRRRSDVMVWCDDFFNDMFKQQSNRNVAA